MCAINGFNFIDKNLILKMNRVTSHRGPDNAGIFLGDNVSLGHNRLSIIDLSSIANQPMVSNDGNLVIVFNGEIYNFLELKSELENSYQFKTKSDTEVVLAAYEKWGTACVRKFNGIFAFAMLDKNNGRILLARDHIGIKPLYYFHRPLASSGGVKFIFSSEVKAILENKSVPRILNRQALNHYFRVLYVPEPLTMFEGIYKLPPASIASLDLKRNILMIENYWDPSENGHKDKITCKKEIADLLRKKISASVKRQIVSDKPLGIFLSGGIDSSAVLDSLSEIKNSIDTFSVGFELSLAEESEKFNKDFYLARKTAKHYNTNHHEVFLASDDVVDLFEKSVWHMDDPVSNPTSIARLKLAQLAKKKVDVILSGEGGGRVVWRV